MLTLSIDGRITLRDAVQLPQHVRALLIEALTIDNPAYATAKTQRTKLPSPTLKFFEWIDFERHLVVPRGFWDDLEDGLRHLNVPYMISDERSSTRAITARWKRVSLRGYQEDALDHLGSFDEGVWKAPPGSGKTVVMLELIRRLGLRACVVTHKLEIAEQWRERAKRHLGMLDEDIKLLAGGLSRRGHEALRDRSLVIAMEQTLWNRGPELQREGFFDSFGLVCLDECHHAPARTFNHVIQRFSAERRYGLSATPHMQQGLERVVELTVGPVRHETHDDELEDEGVLVRPRLVVHSTGFSFPYHRTHAVEQRNQPCGVEGCRRERWRRLHRNNYNELVQALASDPARNEQIASDVADAVLQGRCVLVLSDRLAHLDQLSRLTTMQLGQRVWEHGSPDHSARLFMLTGAEDVPERTRVIVEASKGSCAVFSTIADEALDVPRFDTVFRAWPRRNVDKVEQENGRALRKHPEKLTVEVHEYRDDVPLLKGQLRDRLEQLYAPKRYIMGASVRSLEPEELFGRRRA